MSKKFLLLMVLSITTFFLSSSVYGMDDKGHLGNQSAPSVPKSISQDDSWQSDQSDAGDDLAEELARFSFNWRLGPANSEFPEPPFLVLDGDSVESSSRPLLSRQVDMLDDVAQEPPLKRPRLARLSDDVVQNVVFSNTESGLPLIMSAAGQVATRILSAPRPDDQAVADEAVRQELINKALAGYSTEFSLQVVVNPSYIRYLVGKTDCFSCQRIDRMIHDAAISAVQASSDGGIMKLTEEYLDRAFLNEFRLLFQ